MLSLLGLKTRILPHLGEPHVWGKVPAHAPLPVRMDGGPVFRQAYCLRECTHSFAVTLLLFRRLFQRGWPTGRPKKLRVSRNMTDRVKVMNFIATSSAVP